MEKDWSWLLAQKPSGCGLHNLSDQFALLALQGPKAEAILQPLTPIDLTAIGFYRFAEGEVNGRPSIVARTGYTGEDGFEIFADPKDAPALWRRLAAEGAPHGLLPAGLGARDTLRLEARMMLYGNDMDETTTLVEAGLGWIVSTDEAKGDWNGRAVLAGQKAKGAPRKLVGFEMAERGIPRHGYPGVRRRRGLGRGHLRARSRRSCRRASACATCPRRRRPSGTALEVEIRGRRIAARVVPTPFYKRPRP